MTQDQAQVQAIIDMVVKILDFVKSCEGSPITYRELHYRLLEVAKADPAIHYPNTWRQYKALKEIVAQARQQMKTKGM